MKKFFSLLGILFLLASLSGAFADDKSDKGADASKTDEPYKPFSEVVKGAEKIEGLFNFYKTKDGKVYLEIAPGQLEAPFLIMMNLTSGIGDRGFFAGMPLDDYLFYFHRVNDSIQFIEKNPYFTADPKSPLNGNLKTNFANSILASMKIVSINPENKSVLVGAEDLLLSDLPDLDRQVSRELKGGYTFDPGKSSIDQIKGFPLNDEIDVTENLVTTTQPKEAAFLATVPDWRSIPLDVHFSLSALPSGNYAPRPADDRIGYFETAMRDFSNQDPDKLYVRYISRWNMDKKPIVFWIENTTPYEYRDAVKAGVLEWNKAFARIGIPNALEVKIQPDDAAWNSDIRYNLIYWIDSWNSNFAGFGPSHVDPLTGEIYNASVLVDGSSIQDLEQIYRYEIGLSPSSQKPGPSEECLYQALGKNDAALAMLDLALGSPEPTAPKSFMDAYVKSLVMHEVGHALGLRHNFKGSTLLTLKETQDAALTEKTGLTSSVMDYLPVNAANSKEKQGEYFPSTIGPYDYWAIAYGYSPGEQYRAIANQSNRREYAFATDEDADSPYAVDPTAMTFDLSSDPLGYIENRFVLYDEILAKIDKLLPFPGKSYDQVRRAFDLVFSGYENYSAIPVRYIGGQYFSRNPGEPGSRNLPFRLVGKSEQLRALTILDRNIFSPSAFAFSPELLNKLAPPRRDNHFTDLQIYMTPIDYPILERIGALQNSLLDRMFRPVLLSRLLDNEKKSSNPAALFKLNDYFSWMTDRFWSELAGRQNISIARRNLQISYLDHLTGILLQPKPQIFSSPDDDIPPMPVASVPPDARSLAERQLEILKKRISSALGGNPGMDVETRSHLKRCLSIIQRSLNAKFQESVDDKGASSSDGP